MDIPQHPVDLHSIVTRGTKELSSTLQEFRGVRNLQRSKTVVEKDYEQDSSSTLHQPSPKVSETMSCRQSAIFFSNLADMPHNMYSSVHKCWFKTSWAGNQGNHQNFDPSLLTKNL